MKPKPWSAREERQLRTLYPGAVTAELAASMGRTAKAINSRAKLLGLRKDASVRGVGAKQLWTAKEDAWLRKHYARRSTREIAASLDRPVHSVWSRAGKIGLRKEAEYLAATLAECGRQVGIAGIGNRFAKGHAPANKGTRRPGWAPGRMASTQFRKGQLPHNTLSLGSFRWYGGGSDKLPGYLMLKTGKPGSKPINGWEFVHKLVWERWHGPIPPGYRVWWKDGDHANNALSNLELLSGQDHIARTTVQNLPQPLRQVIQLRGVLNRKLRRLNGHGQEHVA